MRRSGSLFFCECGAGYGLVCGCGTVPMSLRLAPPAFPVVSEQLARPAAERKPPPPPPSRLPCLQKLSVLPDRACHFLSSRTEEPLEPVSLLQTSPVVGRGRISQPINPFWAGPWAVPPASVVGPLRCSPALPHLLPCTLPTPGPGFVSSGVASAPPSPLLLVERCWEARVVQQRTAAWVWLRLCPWMAF